MFIFIVLAPEFSRTKVCIIFVALMKIFGNILCDTSRTTAATTGFHKHPAPNVAIGDPQPPGPVLHLPYQWRRAPSKLHRLGKTS